METVYVKFGWCLDGHHAACSVRSGELACNCDCHKAAPPCGHDDHGIDGGWLNPATNQWEPCIIPEEGESDEAMGSNPRRRDDGSRADGAGVVGAAPTGTLVPIDPLACNSDCHKRDDEEGD